MFYFENADFSKMRKISLIFRFFRVFYNFQKNIQKKQVFSDFSFIFNNFQIFSKYFLKNKFFSFFNGFI